MIYLNMNESLQIPCEGIFWVIDDEVISFADPVNQMDAFDTTDLLHKSVWESIKKRYPFNGKIVNYDFYPRGRVETLVIHDYDGNLDHYEATVYMDRCIGKRYYTDIERDFRLYLNNVRVEYGGQLFVDGSHYTCANCRK